MQKTPQTAVFFIWFDCSITELGTSRFSIGLFTALGWFSGFIVEGWVFILGLVAGEFGFVCGGFSCRKNILN